MASLKDVEQLADDLEGLVGEMRSELRNGPDFEKLMLIADTLGEHADSAAQTFNSVNETLMSRLSEIRGGGKTSSAGRSRQKSAAASSA